VLHHHVDPPFCAPDAPANHDFRADVQPEFAAKNDNAILQFPA
jgi:hypothetical protein